MKYLFFSIFISLFPLQGHSRDCVFLPTIADVEFEHISAVAIAFQLPIAALIGILATEGGKPGQALRNENGSWDMGPYQINTCHVPELARRGIDPLMMLTDARFNVVFAGYLLRTHLDRTGDIWAAIGAYHSRTPIKQAAYIARVRQNLQSVSVQHLLHRINQ